MGLLHDDEASVYELLCEGGKSPFLLTADHAGRLVPRALGDLGVPPAEMDRHIAWDIGIAGVTRRLSAALEATAILQAYSRLVIDCNRQPDVAGAFPEVSEATPVPANKGLDEAGKAARRAAIFDPYHGAIDRLIETRARSVYVAMHSFTPVYLAQARPMHVAVLYNRNPWLSKILADLLRAEGGLVVGENAPYRVSDETDYGVPVHAERRGLDYLEIEIRQDLIAHEAGQAEWAMRLARLLPEALQRLDASTVA
ncbi:N-formylglutamate amidohydrolase [Acidocella aminolytica]|jgi:predicted N-formylglutamate amidohydrolase|uniref:N-formylglutamate amidohydrolase n=1 Tax=Acidocella aminolytica 101 = DSM 11237 TaxID=1120923 RepID=A0A0D6PIZ5_9PROT|nr:N-formylglutamate amidohydrolase [Acidocella aminolytica]GAN81361.1 N-formylglutamate amidohydrolase [Acidocella aminolytica 101 = DSM 11237]GBQ33591.1 N-formylglutamate amidohydrolase [Acidocella aminolytica 101 = DSM 11237]SHF42986.1 Predicted N-formylglutamate amidohydrolase [Acidocella aminolytica 101 = DSM 11237]